MKYCIAVLLLLLFSCSTKEKLHSNVEKEISPIEYALMSSYDLSWIDSFSVDELNQTNQWKRSALTYAVLFNDTTTVKRLIKKGVDLQIRDIWNCSPIDYATVIASRNMKSLFPETTLARIDTVQVSEAYQQQQVLCDTILYQLKRISDKPHESIAALKDIDPNTPMKIGTYGFNYATLVSILATKRYKKPLELLIEHGAYINGKDDNGNYSILAADWDDTAMHTYLLDLGATPNPINSRGVHASVLFAGKGDTLLLDGLHQRGMNLVSRTLIEAIDDSDTAMVRYLSSKVALDSTKNILDDIADLNDSTILTNLITDAMVDSILIRQICQTKDDQSISWIVKKGFALTENDRHNLAGAPLLDSTIINKVLSGITDSATAGKMLKAAMKSHHYNFAEQIIGHIGHIPDSLFKITAYPAAKGDTATIRKLLSLGASLDYPVKNYESLPLLAAASWKQPGSIIGWLIEQGAQINAQHAEYQYSALYNAAETRNWDAMDTLLQRGADPMLATYRGETFHFRLINRDNIFVPTMEKLLKKHPSRDPLTLCGLRTVDTSGRSFFNYVCRYGDTASLKYLLERGKEEGLPSKKELEFGIITAIGSRNREIASILLEQGIACTGIDKEGNSVLHYAISYDDSALFLRGLKHRKLINHQNDSGITPLFIAAQEQSRYKRTRWYLDSLLAHGANLNIASKSGRTPLCFIDDLNYFKKLVTKGASVDIVYKDEGTLLTDAIRGYNKEEFAIEIIKKIKNPNRGTYYGRSPLAVAVMESKPDLIKALVKRGASLQHTSVLYEALDLNNSKILNLLYTLGAKPGKSWEMSGRLLLEAGDSTAFQQLLTRGINPNVRDDKGRTVLMLLGNDTTKASLLFAKGADVHLQDKKKNSALSYAAANRHTEMFQWLLQKGARTKDCNDLLFLAIKGEDRTIIDTLFAHGFSVDTPVISGFSPLFFAAKEDYKGEVLQECIKRSADINQKINGMSALMIAIVTFESNNIKLLLEAGADINASSDKNKRTALHYAAITQHGQVEEKNFTGYLLSKGAEANALDNKGRTPLIWAVKVRNRAAAKLLVNHGADITIKDTFGKSARDYLHEKEKASEYGL